MRKQKVFHKGILGGVRDCAVNALVTAVITAATMLPFKSNSQTLEGRITDLKTGDGIPALTVSIPSIETTETDDDGNYILSSNEVNDAKYELIDFKDAKISIANVLGQDVRSMNVNNNSFRWDGKGSNGIPVAEGMYIAYLNYNPSVSYMFNPDMTNGNINLPAKRAVEAPQGSKERKIMSLDENFELSVTGEGYHDFLRNIDIEGSKVYDFFMIPVESKGDSTNWYYPTVLHGFKEYATTAGDGPMGGKPTGPRPSDLPFNIYRYQAYPGDVEYWENTIEDAINDAESNGEYNWFNNNIIQISGERINEVQSGVILDFVDRPYGGGVAYTHTLATYEDGTAYLWRIELDNDLTNSDAESVVRREIGRMMPFRDAVPIMVLGYVMRHESAGWPNFHPQEIGIFELLYNIDTMYGTKADRPNIRDWYLTPSEDVVADYDFNENKK